jgi:hypothetical protein
MNLPRLDLRVGTESKRRNLRVTGALGLLRAAAELGLIDVPDVIARNAGRPFHRLLGRVRGNALP